RAFVEATKLYALAPRHPYFRRFNLHQDPCPKTLVELPAISGACFFLPREDYLSIGGMDERYFLHAEDLDFCLRFRNAGGRVVFDPFVAVSHFKSSSRANAMRVEFRKTASILRYFRTHFSEPYPPPFMALVAAALWSAFVAKASQRAVVLTLGLTAALPRIGGAGLKRARQLAARRRRR
ncbi:MAG: glycosyltransferase, partial [Parvularculaceae bacterium]|nr:glycosyltransferase [Parvularculaceae bacterium]